MPEALPRPREIIDRALASGRIHSAYLLAGPNAAVRAEALRFARGLVCAAESGERPCEACRECRRSSEEGRDVAELDGSGKRGPLFRHIGDHPDLYWVDRGVEGTRVRIGQARAVQGALRLGSHEGGWRVAVIADAEWLNTEAQNSLLKLLEEPPDRTCLILASASTAPITATIRSRCQRIQFAVEAGLDLHDPELPAEQQRLVARLDRIRSSGLPDLLDWAEEYRGNRAQAAEQVTLLLEVGSEWLAHEIREAAETAGPRLRRELDAYRTLSQCRKELVQRNANPQMVAERALFAVRSALA